MSLLKTEKITKVYHETEVPVHALTDVTLQIKKGEFAAIVGPSGSGKTTFLNIIGGLDKPTSGNVEIAETDISKLSENDLIDFRLNHIGFVFQAYNLIPVLTAKENVEFIMLLQKVDDKEKKKQAEDMLKEVGLEEFMDRFPNQLSGGQQQRVAVARALASKPSFILADEPTANLDSKTAESLLDTMERLNKEHNITFIFSTHDEKVIRRAHRIITLEDGKIKSDKKN